MGVMEDHEPGHLQELQTQMPVGDRLIGNINVCTGKSLTQQEVVRPVANKKVNDQWRVSNILPGAVFLHRM